MNRHHEKKRPAVVPMAQGSLLDLPAEPDEERASTFLEVAPPMGPILRWAWERREES